MNKFPTIPELRHSNLRRTMHEKGITPAELARLLAKAPGQVGQFAGPTRHKGIGDDAAREIEQAMGLAPYELDTPPATALKKPSMDSNAFVLDTPKVKLPVIGSIAAGAWCEVADHFEPGHADEWIDAPGPVGPNAFILKVEGISMEPKFFEGDKVVIDPSLECLPGHFVVAKRISDQAVTFKQLKAEGTEQYLYALNPAWPDRIIRLNEEWMICGRAKWKITDL